MMSVFYRTPVADRKPNRPRKQYRMWYVGQAFQPAATHPERHR